MSLSLLLGESSATSEQLPQEDVILPGLDDPGEEDGGDDEPFTLAPSKSAAAPTTKQPQQPRASSRISARRSRQAAAEAERRASAAAPSWSFGTGGDVALASASTPLWRELRAASEETRRRAGAKEREAKLAKQQQILRHIAWTRLAQDLPPVFAILRGPTIRPYRMEELSLTLGRVTPRHRDVGLPLDSHNVKISRVHARIVYDRGQGCYCIVNLSKNGVRVKHGDTFLPHVEVGLPVPLPNPATIDVQGTLLYFQVFYVASTPTGQYAANGEEDVVEHKKKGHKSSSSAGGGASKRKRGQGVTYSEMIQTALRALGGAATQPKISRYIQEHFREDIAGRATWRNSVSGVLSANPLFIQEAIISEGGKKDRKSLWRLKGFPISGGGRAAALAKGEEEIDSEEDEDEGALVMDDGDDDDDDSDEEDDDGEEDDDNDEDDEEEELADARLMKRSRTEEGGQ